MDTVEDCMEKLFDADEEINSLLKSVLENDPLENRRIKRKLIRRFSPEFQRSDLPARNPISEGFKKEKKSENETNEQEDTRRREETLPPDF